MTTMTGRSRRSSSTQRRRDGTEGGGSHSSVITGPVLAPTAPNDQSRQSPSRVVFQISRRRKGTGWHPASIILGRGLASICTKLRRLACPTGALQCVLCRAEQVSNSPLRPNQTRTHARTHSPIHSFARCLIDPSIHPLIHSFNLLHSRECQAQAPMDPYPLPLGPPTARQPNPTQRPAASAPCSQHQ